MIKITTQKEVEINQRGRRSKYRWVYDRIDKDLERDEILLIENIDTIREARLIIMAIKRQYDNIEVHLRKYSESGLDKPTIYLNWR